MKKKYTMVFIIIAVFVLGVIFCLYAYHIQKSNDNLPSLQYLSEMEEAEINKIVCGYKRTQLNYIWQDPDEADEDQDIWNLGDGRCLRVHYNNQDEAVIGDIYVELFPDDTRTVKMIFSAGTAVETECELAEDEITDAMDWAAGLDLEPQEYGDGEAPNQVYAGGEAYTFEINDGEQSFSYLWIDNYYVVAGDYWYLVKNPALPPVAL